MNESIHITPDRIYTTRWNPDKRVEEEMELKAEDLTEFCWELVEFEEKITLGRLFKIVGAAPNFWEAIIQENIGPLLEEIQKDPDPGWKREGLERLELSWIAENDIFEGKKSFELYTGFNGVGPAKGLEGVEDGEEIGYGVEFTPVNNMRDLEVVLNHKVVLITTDLDDENFSWTQTELGEHGFTVLELFRGIFWELTFAGTPEEREEKFQKLVDTVEEIKNEEATLLSADETLEQIQKELDEESEQTKKKVIKRKKKRKHKDWGL